MLRRFFRLAFFCHSLVEFSLLIECIQLGSKVGSFDVDDMILNTLGGSLGYLCFWVARKWKKRRNEKKEE